MGFLTVGLFERHSRRRMEVAAFSYGANDGSSVRDRIRNGADLFLALSVTPHTKDLAVASRTMIQASCVTMLAFAGHH